MALNKTPKNGNTKDVLTHFPPTIQALIVIQVTISPQKEAELCVEQEDKNLTKSIGTMNLEICPKCSKHGCIVSPDGFASTEFCFQRHARTIIDSGVTFGIITSAEAIELKQALRNSGLPVDWDKIDIAYLWNIELYNAKRCQDFCNTIGTAHDWLQQKSSKVPSDFMTCMNNIYPL